MPEDDVDFLLAPLPSGRHGLTREQVVRSQRARLLRAAVAVAGTEGYAGMTVSAVIAHASVSRKTFYEQFADREDCFLAAYELVMARALSGTRAASALDAPWRDRVRAALAWAIDALARHPYEARVAFAEVLAAGARALERRDQVLREFAQLLAPGVDAAPGEAGLSTAMPTATVGALWELIGGHVRRGHGAELPGLLPDLLYCALAPFLGPVAAAEAAADATPELAAVARGA
ncbi:MAG TPA: TetR/AcrR family transcriptional regulator [Conexibacter sp.]